MPSRLTAVLVLLLLASTAVAFWLWLVIVPVRVAMLCPEECRCDPGGYRIRCNGSSISVVSLIHLTDVQRLYLFNNNLTCFEEDSFVSLTELDILFVDGCGLRTIELGAFNGLTNLRELFIVNNEISEIFPGTFVNLNSLNLLYLVNNQLENLDRGVFSGLFNLKYIYLSYNKLHSLHPDTFLGLSRLQLLNLDKNLALQLPIDRNFIVSFSLLELSVSGCNISSLSVETIEKVSALQRLDLSDNNLETVDINILKALPELSILFLYDNPLQCDCQLQEVWRWCKDRNIRTVYERLDEVWAPKCDKPIEVERKWWGVSEKGQCLEGNIQYSGDYNSTSYSETDIIVEEYYDYDVRIFKQYQVPVYAFPFIFGTTANVILLIIILFNKDMRTVPNMYILNLVISDIIYLTVLFSEASANTISEMWLVGDPMCMFLPFCRRMCIGLSAYSVAMFSFQRYRVTVNPFQVHVSSQATWCSTVATLFGVWILAALFAVPSALSKYLFETLNLSSNVSYYKYVVIFVLLLSCVIPLCVIAFTYFMTARHLVESSSSISEGTQNPQHQTRRNSAKIVVGLTVVFVISYVPYHVFWTYFIWSEKILLLKFKSNLVNQSNKFQYTYLISNCFLLINPCLNPVALICTSSQFRQHLKRYLTCFCRTSSHPTDLELARRN